MRPWSSSSGGKRDRLTADAGAWLGAEAVVRAGLCDCVRPNVRASTELLCDWSPACPARNWRFAVVGCGFEEGELVDVSGDGWGVFGVYLLRRGGRSSQNRLSDDTGSLFFGRPARAGRTLTVKVLSSNRRSSLYDLADALARGANGAGDLGLCEA